MSEILAWMELNRIYLLIGMGFLLGIMCAVYVMAWMRRRLGGKNLKRGRKAEKKAIKMLQRAGFHILERNPRFQSELWVDGHLTRFEVTPDLLVEAEGQRYVVEIKSYRDQVSINKASVRRQVIEYLRAASLPCLLVTMPEGEMEVIAFDHMG